jgi:peptide-methionine (R)-S-oxide reductase
MDRRRAMMGAVTMGVTGAALAAPGPARARELHPCGTAGDGFAVLRRTDEEWRNLLSEEEYRVLRLGGTERLGTSPYAAENLLDIYHCRGCGTALYRAEEYVPMEIGFVFFAHSIPAAVLTGIDETDLGGMLLRNKKMVQVNCRCCGSHLGHLVAIGGRVLHCINGTSLAEGPTIY